MAMTDEPLSSSWTPYFRWVLAPVWVLGIGAAAWRTGSMPFVILWIGGSLAILWYAVPLCRVMLRGDSLIVSRLGRQVVIPAQAVRGVRRVSLLYPARAELLLDRDYGAGDRIRLLLPVTPASLLGGGFGATPGLERLRDRLRERGATAAAV
jgi:hypothetical protein